MTSDQGCVCGRACACERDRPEVCPQPKATGAAGLVQASRPTLTYWPLSVFTSPRARSAGGSAMNRALRRIGEAGIERVRFPELAHRFGAGFLRPNVRAKRATTAGHQARRPGWHIFRPSGLASVRRLPLNSNVRPQEPGTEPTCQLRKPHSFNAGIAGRP